MHMDCYIAYSLARHRSCLRSSVGGVALSVLAVLFDLPSVASSFVEELQEWGITWNVQQMVTFSTDNVTADDLWRSSAILAAYCAVISTATYTYVVFNGRDITSG